MDALFRTGYPHPINLFAALMLTLLPLLSPLSREADRPPWQHALAVGLAYAFLAVWSRIRVVRPGRSLRYFQAYILGQVLVVSVIYALDGALTRFLFVVVAVQAVYLSPVRRWAPFLATLAALWLTLYLVISPGDPGANKVSTIGMYFCYLVFAAMVTFTTVQQERQDSVAQELLDGVNERNLTLRAYDQTIEQRAEVEERERLAGTIHAALQQRLGRLTDTLDGLITGVRPMGRQSARAARLEAKEALASVRDAVRTLRPGELSELAAEDGPPAVMAPPADEGVKVTDPVRVYHVWNLGVIVVTTGVLAASLMVAGNSQWLMLTALGGLLLLAYGACAVAEGERSRLVFLGVQGALIVAMIWLSQDPLMSHLFLIIAAQAVFLGPPRVGWLLVAVAAPTVLNGMAFHLSGVFRGRPGLFLAWTAALAVTYFFAAVMAFMTRRQVESRRRAIVYARQLEEVNRLLEARLSEVRQMAIMRERVRMAREIHDGMGHHLTVVIVQLQFAEELADEDPEAAVGHLHSARTILGEAMAASRDMVQTLQRFDRPLPEALHELVRAWESSHAAEVTLKMRGDLISLPTAVRMTIYRTVQEALTNVHKHARATRVEIILARNASRVILKIGNDGDGTPAPVPEGSLGFGLVGLRERAAALSGEFKAGPREGGGFDVSLILPLGA